MMIESPWGPPDPRLSDQSMAEALLIDFLHSEGMPLFTPISDIVSAYLKRIQDRLDELERSERRKFATHRELRPVLEARNFVEALNADLPSMDPVRIQEIPMEFFQGFNPHRYDMEIREAFPTIFT